MDHASLPAAPARDQRSRRADPDPGTPRSRLVAVILACLVTLVVVAMQNAPAVGDMFSSAPAEVAGTARGEVVPPGMAEPVNLLGRMYVRLAPLIKADPQAMPTLDQYAVTAEDRLRVAVVAGELLGTEATADRLADTAGTLEAGDPLLDDARLFQRAYREGSWSLTAEERARLTDHHGFFADVALTHDLEQADPARLAPRAHGLLLLVLMLGFGAFIVVAFLAGFVAFVFAGIGIGTGRLTPSMPVPAPGGSVMLEVFALFVGGFLLLQLVMGIVERNAPAGAAWPFFLGLGLQWLLLLTPLWPLARGMSFAQLRAALGWHSGRGVFREIGAGILGYLAGLPLFAVGVVTTLALYLILELVRANAGLGDPAVPQNPIIDLVGSSGPLGIFMVFTLATVWAPLCEETVFRGALQRHLRSRLAGPLAALFTAIVFGFMHGYGPLAVFPLIALGSVFGALREWRGSLIASITAHALHNGTVLTMLLLVLSLLGT